MFCNDNFVKVPQNNTSVVEIPDTCMSVTRHDHRTTYNTKFIQVLKNVLTMKTFYHDIPTNTFSGGWVKVEKNP